MGYEATDWAWGREGLTATQRLVLVALAQHANGADGTCWPSSRRLRVMTCLSERALRKALRDLEAGGLISCRPGSGKQSSRYRLHMQDRDPVIDPGRHDVPEGAAAGAGETGTTCRGEGHETPYRGAPDAREAGTKCRPVGREVPPESPANPNETGKEPQPGPSMPHQGSRGTHRHAGELNRQQRTRFERFWSVYPRKVAKGEARKAWRQIDPDEDLTDRICAAVETARQTEQWRRDGGRYIPHPATWLRREGWDDQHEPEVTPLGAGGRESERIGKTISNLRDLFGGSHGGADIPASADVPGGRLCGGREHGEGGRVLGPARRPGRPGVLDRGSGGGRER